MSVPGNGNALRMRRRGGAVAPVYDLTPKALSGAFKLGVNMSGPESSGDQYPSLDMLTHYAAHGMSFIRQPLGWPAMQPTLGGAISTTEFAKLSAVLAMCKTLGITVLIDANHTVDLGAGRNGFVLGSSSLPISYLVDYWTKLIARIMADPSYSAVHGYSPINEPHGLDPNNPNAPSTPYSQNVCFQLNQQVLTAIRNAGDTKPFYVAGDHYQGAWDWVVNNAAWFLNLVDPANALVADVHCYLDGDSSGSNYTWAQVLSNPLTGAGQAPPGLAPNVNIGPQRLSNVVAWAYAHGVKMALTECGWGFDAPYLQAGDAMTAYVQACNIEFTYWSAGYNFTPNTGYYYDPDPYVPGTNNRDFSPSGVPSPQSAVLQKYAAAPTAYPLFLPVDGSNVPIRRGVSGVASSPFKILFGGNISSPITITPHAKTADGTDLGWTFTPSSVVMAAGQHINEQLSFTATPTTATAGAQVGTTNNGGLADPPLLGFSSGTDSFIADSINDAAIVNIYGLRRLYASYIGHAIRLRPAWDTSGNSDMDFDFNTRGDLPRQFIQTWARSRTIAVVKIYDQSPAANHLSVSQSSPILTLVNAQGYPEITVGSGQGMAFNSPVDGNAQQSILARIYDVNGGATFISQDNQVGSLGGHPFRFSPGGYQINGGTSVSLGRIANAWHHYAGSYTSGLTNGLAGYRDGSLVASNTVTGALTDPAGGYTSLGYFSQYTPVYWTGSWQSLVVLNVALSAGQVAVFASDDATYYSTALPDTLSAVAPTISGTAPTSVVQGSYDQPFAGVTIADTNTGSPTDSVSIALTGGTGTLAGTGLSGSGPYTIAAASAASITSTLRALQWTPSGSGGSTTTFALTVTSSAGTTATDSATVVTVQAYVAEPTLTVPANTFTPISMRGANFSAAESNGPYASPSYIQPYIDRGIGIIRLPINLGNLYPTAYSPLAAQHVSGIQGVLDNALSKNVYVIVDFHSYGGITDSRDGVYKNIATDPEAANLFVDAWTRTATEFKHYPNFIMGLDNEPQGSGTATQQNQQLIAVYNRVLSAVRGVGANQLVLAMPCAYGHTDNFAATHGPAWSAGLIDPANNWAIECHEYLGPNNNDEPNVSTGAGGRLANATTWARANGMKLFLGEFGWGTTDNSPGNIDTETSAFMNHLRDNADVWAGWTYFAAGPYYVGQMSIHFFTAGVERPQLTKIKAYF